MKSFASSISLSMTKLLRNKMAFTSSLLPALFCILAPSAHAQYLYSSLDLPTGANSSSYATGISGSKIVGFYTNGTPNSQQGYLYNTSTQTYASLNDPNGILGTEAVGIDGSNVVGFYTTGSGSDVNFLYNGTSYRDITNLPLGSGTDFVWGISGNSVVGTYGTNGRTSGFLFNLSSQTYSALNDPLTLNDPLSAGSGTFAQALSGSNIVGYYTDASSATHGFLYDGSTWTSLNDPYGAEGTWAEGISGSNIVGYYLDASGAKHGFIYNGLNYTSLDDPASQPYNVNGSEAPGATVASGISGGNIVGYYLDNGTSNQNFMAIEAVPEPSSWGLVTFGIVLLGILRNRKRWSRVSSNVR